MAEVSQRITLQVGEQTFVTTRPTLAGSGYFEALFSQHPNEQTEFFIDGDPDLFQHILRYLRTGMFPLFHDRDKGHDPVLYTALLQQARFYQVEPLVNWISHKRYLAAVWTKQRPVFRNLYGDKQIEAAHDFICHLGESWEVVSMEERFAKCWNCPSRNWRHQGMKASCVKGGCYINQYRDQTVDSRIVGVLAIVKSVETDESVCLPMDLDHMDPPPYAPAHS
jgi:hypothetical protein